MTVTDLLTRSLNLLGVSDPGNELLSIDATTAITALNGMMARYEEDGISVGWTPVALVSETVPAPDANLEGIAALLAIKLSVEYKAPVSDELRAMAEEGMRAMQRDSIKNAISATDLRFLPGAPRTFNIISG